MKICSKCGIERPLSEYSKNGKKKDGSIRYKSTCKVCNRKYNKEYLEENRETIRKRKKEYYKENECRLKKYNKGYNKKNRERRKEYRKNNKDRIKERKKEYYKENRDKIEENIKKYVEKNIDKIKEYKKKYCKENRERKKEYDKEYCKDKRDKEYKRLLEEFVEYVKQNPQYQDYKADVWTYMIRSDGFWKIGVATQLNRRMGEISCHIPVVEVYKLPINIESRLHLEFDEHRFCFDKKWSGYTELFNFSDELAYEIIKRERFKKVLDISC